MPRYASLDRAVRVLSGLLRGEEYDRAAIAQLGSVELATADRQIVALAKCPGVVQERKGRRKILRFDANLIAPIPTFPEVIAAALGTSLSKIFAGSAYERAMQQALQFVVARGRRQAPFRHVERKFLFIARGGEIAFPELSSNLDDLVDAVLHSKWTTIAYRHFDGTPERIRIQPLSIAIYDHQLYVVALRDQRPYPFRFARIQTVDVDDDATFEYPSRAIYDPDELFRDSIGIFISESYPVERVAIRLAAKWARYAEAHRWHGSQRLVRNSDNSVTLHMRVRTCPELEMWILSFGEDAEVEQPAPLRDRIARRSAALAAIYTKGTQLRLL
jgi:predicted DNA-binding transcriptional regulator YafY